MGGFPVMTMLIFVSLKIGGVFMHSKFGTLVALVLMVFVLSGCYNAGMFASANLTNVSLEAPNYALTAKNVSGEAQAGYILGLSASSGMGAATLALARVNGTGLLYKEALENFWQNYEAAHGTVEGKKLGLVNVRYDADILNLVVYTEVKISVRADVIEFKE
jgi:hypothetical protein